MPIRSLSLLVCGLLVACGGTAQKPSVRSGAVESGSAGAAGGAVKPVDYSGSGVVLDRPIARARLLDAWRPSDPSRWKSALNYVPSVRSDNQTALGQARFAFARYMNVIHNRIHPLFAQAFLSSLDSLPAEDPMTDQRLNTELEIILNQESGDVVRMGVSKSSGITAFDIAALKSVRRAAPFGAPPSEIVSSDGNVYIHWEFHRNKEACSTFNARPFLLKAQPKAAAY